MKLRIFGMLFVAGLAVATVTIALEADSTDQKVGELLSADRGYSVLAQQAFDTMGWDLPDGGRSVKALADAAPGGAFDPRKLETISSSALGYHAKWDVVRYKYYGLDWDITGLHIVPNKPEPGLPTLAIINGGSANYIGPLNPIKGSLPLDVAKAWFAAEKRRRPQFKQVLQDMEHQGMVEHRARLEKEIRETLNGNSYGVRADDVIRQLFSTMNPPLKGYRKMAWVVGRLDDGHWDPEPEKAHEWNFAERFRKENPGTPIRVLMINSPITHYAHIERPKQLAAVLVGAVKWVNE